MAAMVAATVANLVSTSKNRAPAARHRRPPRHRCRSPNNLQRAVGIAAPASRSLAPWAARNFTALWASGSSSGSETCDRFETTQPGWVSRQTTSAPAARSHHSSSRPQNIPAGCEAPLFPPHRRRS